ncbi:hypothetical protein PR048_010049 [Dryococelus australis]|uniref:Uncharacterized protein n=1 Tax=Dryococelus australis TaxID=614101 RepID=A0ABQ9I1K9_9NEOP|nr:hypothetical protein PR048_010049 [Dryococelus australis]
MDNDRVLLCEGLGRKRTKDKSNRNLRAWLVLSGQGELLKQKRQSPKEKRGVDTRSKTYHTRKQNVRTFIQRIQCVQLHYIRNKSTRQYLPSHYSIRTLWKDYNNENSALLGIKYHVSRDLFIYDFNISFNTPAMHACSDYIRLNAMISSVNSAEKNDLLAQHKLHKLISKAFYDILKTEEPFVLKLPCESQKNLLLPKLLVIPFYLQSGYLADFEKIVKKRETIISPQKYRTIFEEYATVKTVGEEVPACDCKGALGGVIKPPSQLHCKFASAKIITLTIGVPVKPAKCTNANKMLTKHFGPDW